MRLRSLVELFLSGWIASGAVWAVHTAPGKQDAAKVSAPATTSTVPDWATLKAAYDYDAKATVKVTSEERPDEALHIEHLVFTNAKGQSVTGLFVRPKAEGVYPVSLVLHGWTSSKEGTIDFIGKTIASKGIACLALDAPHHGERKPKEASASGAGTSFMQVVHDGILDYRQIIGYLTHERKDVDGKRLGLIGNSMGAMMGAILTAVDDRITVASLCVGGDLSVSRIASLPAAAQPLTASASPSLYIGHISPRPLFLLNALQDETVNEAAAKRFQEAAKEPKTMVWVPSGHVLPPEQRLKAIDWLVEKLKPAH